MSNFVDVLDLQGNTVIEMLSSDWKDYEDATQNATALWAEGDCIVTRKQEGFYEFFFTVYTPCWVVEYFKPIKVA